MAENFPCPSCGRPFKSQGALTKHVNSAHGDNVLTKLQAQYGSMAPRPGGAWRPDRPLRAAPSGIPSIDYAIGIGGLPKGTIIEIYGPPSSGKTTVALSWSAYAQQQGLVAGYVDAEHRFQHTMAKLIPGLDLDALYFSDPKDGNAALNITKDFIETGQFAVWTVDSVHGCTPKQLLEKPIGDDAAMAALARLMSVGCQVLDVIVAETNTVCIFVNHVKTAPGVRYGKDWSKPGGTALDYYASVQLRVTPIALYLDESKRKIGQTVKVKVENSKVAAPFAQATYDVFLAPGKIKKPGDERDGQVVMPGVDVGSSWFSVAEEDRLIREKDGKWSDSESGELYGTKREVVEMLETDCELRRRLHDLIYSDYAEEKVA